MCSSALPLTLPATPLTPSQVYRGPGVGTGACERCHRLAKQCVPSETVRKRTPRRQIVSRTAQLEEKLDDLVTLLKTQRQAKDGAGSTSAQGPSPRTAPPSRSPETITRASPSGIRLPRFSQHMVPDIPSPPSSHDAEPSTLLSAEADKATPSPQPTPASASSQGPAASVEAELSLDAFRSRFIRFFPFVHIPVSMTAQNLQRDRPLTLLAIRCVTAKTFAKQHELGDELRDLIANKAVVHYEISMDILLALLTFSGW